MIRLLTFLLLVVTPSWAQEQVHETAIGDVRVARMVEGLKTPWALAFLPGGEMLITERGGRLLHFDAAGQRQAVSGVPPVVAVGQGGLLDVVVARDFATSREIFLTYSEPQKGGAATALAVASLSQDGASLENLKVIFRMASSSPLDRHFGSRIVEAHDGTLFMTIGDRGEGPLAQDPNTHNGKIIRIQRDGSPAVGNPFIDGGGLPEIYSIGHRNPQGAAIDANGTYFTVAHGPRGGDEINRPEAGKNYGWPVISYGRHYSGLKVGVGVSAPGMEQPLYYWDPSIAPSGMLIYSGKLWPEWQGDFFVGSLKFDYISRLELRGDDMREAEQLFLDSYNRVRDIREAPDGSIWFLAAGDGAAYRVTPLN